MNDLQRDELLISISKGLTNLQEIVIANHEEHKKDIERLETKIDNVEKNLREEFITKIEEVRVELNEKIEGVRVELNEKIEAVRVELNEKIEAVRVELNERIEEVRVELNERIEEVRVELNERIEEVRVELNEKIEGVRKELKADITRIDSNIDAMPDVIRDIYSYGEKNDAKLEKRVDNCERDIREIKKKLA